MKDRTQIWIFTKTKVKIKREALKQGKKLEQIASEIIEIGLKAMKEKGE